MLIISIVRMRCQSTANVSLVRDLNEVLTVLTSLFISG